MSCATVAVIGLHLVSWHSASEREQNNYNPGIYGRLDCGIQAGIFYNSEERVSVYGAYALDFDLGWVSPFIIGGAATGYEVAPVVPLAVVGAGIGLTQNFTARIGYIPGLYDLPHTIHLTIERKF